MDEVDLCVDTPEKIEVSLLAIISSKRRCKVCLHFQKSFRPKS